jgi:ATP adenylyltransferase
MKNLWAPWRMAYVEAASGDENKSEVDRAACIFCHYPGQDEKHDRENLLLHRGERAFVMLNRYPYSNAHLLVVPYAHERDLAKLLPDMHDDLFRLTTRMTELLRHAVNAEGINVGMNLGRCAGAGIADHLHVHLVPRWNGDTNFMPVLAEAKVIGEHLLTTYDRLKSLL